MTIQRTARFALGVLIYNLAVILWGALVRATDSGAGCGAHWPACNGEILPGLSDVHRVIEFTHRASVGVGLVLIVWIWLLVVRSFPKGHAARCAAHASLLFTLTESAIGAGLVLFKLVAQDMSVYRAVAISAHLVNTFLLVASLALTVLWTSGRAPIRISGQGAVGWLVGAALVGAILVGVTGAVTALGDTLFKGKSLQEIHSATSGSIPFFVSLRVYHPMAAVAIGLFSAFSAWVVASLRPGGRTQAAAYWVTLLVVAQICAGFANYLMRVPLAMQLIHLLLADALWIALVAMAAAALAEGAPRALRMSQKSMTPESTR